jgi:Flp pilus assembly pilin Flp
MIMMAPDVSRSLPTVGQLLGLHRRASSTLRRWHRDPIRQQRSERGASLVEYVLLVGLIAVIAVTAVGFLGTSVSNLFSHEANCITVPGDTNLQTGTSQLQQANSLSSDDGSSTAIALTSMDSQANGNQLSTGLQINGGGGTPPDAPACNATANNGNQNQNQVLQLLR